MERTEGTYCVLNEPGCATQGDLEASKSGAVLLSKDYNMCLKAQANGLKALTPTQFPAAQPHLHKHLLAISSETSPVKHSPAQDTSPPPPPKALSDLPLTPRQGAAALPTGASRPALTPGQSQAAPGSATALSASGKHSHPSESTSNGKSFVYPADRLAQQGAKKTVGADILIASAAAKSANTGSAVAAATSSAAVTAAAWSGFICTAAASASAAAAAAEEEEEAARTAAS